MLITGLKLGMSDLCRKIKKGEGTNLRVAYAILHVSFEVYF